MKKITLTIPTEILIKDYLDLGSSYKVAEKYNVSASTVRRILKESGVLRTQNEAVSIRNKRIKSGTYVRTKEWKEHMSIIASKRTGNKNHFFGKKHNDITKQRIGIASKKRTGKRCKFYYSFIS